MSKIKIILTTFVILISLVYLFSLYGNYNQLKNSELRLQKAKEEKIELEKELKGLLLELKKVESQEYKEFQARDKLGLVKEGEYVVVLPDEDILRRLSPREDGRQTGVDHRTNFEKWMELFKGR